MPASRCVDARLSLRRCPPAATSMPASRCVHARLSLRPCLPVAASMPACRCVHVRQPLLHVRLSLRRCPPAAAPCPPAAASMPASRYVDARQPLRRCPPAAARPSLSARSCLPSLTFAHVGTRRLHFVRFVFVCSLRAEHCAPALCPLPASFVFVLAPDDSTPPLSFCRFYRPPPPLV